MSGVNKKWYGYVTYEFRGEIARNELASGNKISVSKVVAEGVLKYVLELEEENKKLGDCRQCEPTCPLLDGREVADLAQIQKAAEHGHSQNCAEHQVWGGVDCECEKEA